MAAVTVIHQTAKHRKGMLDQIVAHCIQILAQPVEQRNPRMKDGALHVLGILANLLMKVVCGFIPVSVCGCGEVCISTAVPFVPCIVYFSVRRISLF